MLMSEQTKPLVQALFQFKEKHPISYHVPGHKNGLLSSLPEEIKSALQYDMTELEGLDDLHEPSGSDPGSRATTLRALSIRTKLLSRQRIDGWQFGNDVHGLQAWRHGYCATKCT